MCVMANDYTVKAGSWGGRVQKIIRIQERAERLQVPLVYLVDAAGARISEQIRISRDASTPAASSTTRCSSRGWYHRCASCSGRRRRLAYLPALTDVVIMVEGKASLYVGSPRMVEMAIGEKTTLEELGGARMHCEVSGCGDVLAPSDEEAIDFARRYLAFMPGSSRERPPAAEARPPAPAGPSRRSFPTTSGSGSTCTR